jgi:hypothetical protein
MSAVPPRPKRSLFSLIGDLPGLVMDLVRSEIEHLKQELITRIAQAGTGIALLAVGASVLFFALGAFVTAAILGLAEVLPAWASALIVGGGLVLLAVLVVLIGVAVLKRGAQGPAESIDSIKQDVRAIKGIGRQD